MYKHFDILETGHHVLWYPGIGLLVFIVCICFFIFFQIKSGSRQQKGLTLILTLFSFVWTFIWWVAGGSKYYECIDALKTKNFVTVQGYVTEFDPMPKEGHKHESFIVEGIKFEYSDFEPSCGFHNSKSHGGPIDEGKYVKINYFDGLIIQLWIKQ